MTSHLRSNAGLGPRRIVLAVLAGVSLPLCAANGPAPENLPASECSTDCQVPVLWQNYLLHTQSWSFNLTFKQREPFSYARQIQAANPLPPPGPEPLPPANFAETLSVNYATGQNLFSTGLEDSAAGRFEQARLHLQECLTRLDGTLVQTKHLQATSAQESRDLAQANFYLTAILRLQEAARQALKKVAVREQFEQQVLHAAAFEVRAVLAPAENAAAASGALGADAGNATAGAVLFAGYATPYKVGDRIVLPATGTAAAVEIRILALSRTAITVLFDHQASFEMPILLDAPAGGNSPAGKH